MSQRRSHTKSRKGCLQCKRRHAKVYIMQSTIFTALTTLVWRNETEMFQLYSSGDWLYMAAVEKSSFLVCRSRAIRVSHNSTESSYRWFKVASPLDSTHLSRLWPNCNRMERLNKSMARRHCWTWLSASISTPRNTISISNPPGNNSSRSTAI